MEAVTSLKPVIHNRSTPRKWHGRRRVPGSRPDSNEDPTCMWACCTLSHAQAIKRLPSGVVLKFGVGVPVQVSFSSSDGGSKLRGLSQNRLLVASKRDVNITKLN
ncbi:hypothetical protein AVEN_150176-1 [Araneus ventricosus]|uniref:Uncharacterized protein n=1 Tax=Araneus ventricosus TaxID=182803 RepID=A0A4Y2J8M0_ARAVE|nr:hypothetical protein AVEN_150176-1 [Araneus ventricosus]